MPYVYSTVTGPISIVKYSTPPPGGLPEVVHSVTIKGGANLANRHGDTPNATVTELTDAELAFCMEQPMFRQHVADKFFTVWGTEIRTDAIVVDMVPKDRSAPKTPEDFPKAAKAA